MAHTYSYPESFTQKLVLTEEQKEQMRKDLSLLEEKLEALENYPDSLVWFRSELSGYQYVISNEALSVPVTKSGGETTESHQFLVLHLISTLKCCLVEGKMTPTQAWQLKAMKAPYVADLYNELEEKLILSDLTLDEVAGNLQRVDHILMSGEIPPEEREWRDYIVPRNDFDPQGDQEKVYLTGLSLVLNLCLQYGRMSPKAASLLKKVGAAFTSHLKAEELPNLEACYCCYCQTDLIAKEVAREYKESDVIVFPRKSRN